MNKLTAGILYVYNSNCFALMLSRIEPQQRNYELHTAKRDVNVRVLRGSVLSVREPVPFRGERLYQCKFF